LSMYLFKTQLLIDGNEKITHDCLEHFLNNTLYYDSNKTADNKMLMWSRNQYNAQTYLWCTVLPANSGDYEYNIRLNNIFSHLNIYRNFIKTDNVKIRVYFNSFLSDLADESVIKMSNLTLKVDGVRIWEAKEKNLLSNPFLTYNYTKMYKRTSTLNSGLVSGQSYEIKIDSYNYKSLCVLVFVTPINDSTSKLNNFVKFYELSTLKIVDKNNESLCNNNNYSCYSDLIYNCCKYWFKESSFFLSKSVDGTHKNNFYLLNFSSNIASDILNNTHSGSREIPEGSKIVFTSSENSNQAVSINIILFSPSFLNVTNNDIKIFDSTIP